MVWTKNDYDNADGMCLDSFLLDYCEKGDKFDIPFWHYMALKQMGATVKSFSPWDKLTIGVIVVVDNEFAYRDTVDRLLAENGFRDYVYIK